MKPKHGIVLTGATGFLGRRIVPLLAAEGAAPVALGRSPVAGCNACRDWQAEDPPERTISSLRGVRVVLHVAAHIPAKMDDPSEAEKCLRVNAIGTLSLVLAAKAAGVEKFVLISSGNLAERSNVPVPDAALPTRHRQSAAYYLGSKFLAESYLLAAAQDAMRVAIVRPSSIYGPGMRPGILSLIISRVQNGGSLALHDGGRHTGDYVFVDDVAWLVSKIALGPAEGFFNAGSGRAIDLQQLTQVVRELLPDSSSKVTVEPANCAASPTGFPALDISRARNELGYRPTSLRNGLLQLLKRPG